jgi:hypothetical protein
MSFKTVGSLIISSLLLLLTACSDAEKENKLVELFDAASLDLIAISFPADTADVISIDTFIDYTIEGLKSNGVDTVPVTEHIDWSLSEGAVSSIDKNGRLSAGSVAEAITVTAKVGQLSATQAIRVSAAKFDQVVMLNSAPVSINVCQAQQITPIGSYLNDDGSEEIRPVDSTIINTIAWLIRNQADDAPSQRAFINTVSDKTTLQALEAGEVFIQAQAMSISSGTIVTSADFSQTLSNNLNSLKLCLKSDTDLSACSISNTDIVKDEVVSLQAVGNYQATDGSSSNQNISAYSKWGIDDTSIATIAFSSDRQQVDVTGVTADSTANVTVACGKIEEDVTDSEIENGVVLGVPVTCASGNLNCLSDSVAMNVVAITVTSLSVTANGASLTDNSTFRFAIQPLVIAFEVTANFSDGSSETVTADTGTSYNNKTITVINGLLNQPGEYTVLSSGDAEVDITFQGETFSARLFIPN